MSATIRDVPNERPRLSETDGFVPYRRGEEMTDETRARLREQLNWQFFMRELASLCLIAHEESEAAS